MRYMNVRYGRGSYFGHAAQRRFFWVTFLCIRGLGFKFVDFLYKSSDVCHTEIKIISSENIFFYLSYKLLSIALLIIVSTQQ